jgi:CHAD domain-containing protein
VCHEGYVDVTNPVAKPAMGSCGGSLALQMQIGYAKVAASGPLRFGPRNLDAWGVQHIAHYAFNVLWLHFSRPTSRCLAHAAKRETKRADPIPPETSVAQITSWSWGPAGALGALPNFLRIRRHCPGRLARRRFTFIFTAVTLTICEMNGSTAYSPFQKRLEAFARERPGVGQGNVEALHRTRVASRRLRELLPLLPLDRDTSRTLDRRLRRVTKQLGIVRELDVLMLLIEELQQNRRYPSAALNQVRTAVGLARNEARGRLTAKLPTAKLERLSNRLRRAVKALESDDATLRGAGSAVEKRAWLWALEARLARRATSVRSAIDVANGLYVPERLHDVRIALKKLRYAAELHRGGTSSHHR